MAAKPKLTNDGWASARKVWESDPRKGFPWLIEELGLPVSAEAVRQRSKQESWVKAGEKPSLGKPMSKLGKPEKPSLENKPKIQNVTKPKPVELISNEQPDWEEVEETETNIVGRPSKYMPHFDRQAYQLCLLGATDKDMSDFFGVSEVTINAWKHRYPEFLKSIKVGKLYADAVMAERLYQRGIGYSHPHTHVSVIENEVVLTELTKHYPPDTKAAFLWLKNRQPALWRDKTEVKADVTVTPIPWDELREITKAAVAEAEQKQQELLATRYAALGIKREEYYSD